MIYEKIFNSFFSFLFFSFLFLNAQDVKSFSCGTDELHIKNLKENFEYSKKFEENTKSWQEYAQKNYNKWDNSKSQNKNTNFIPPQVTTLNIAIHDMSINSSFLPTTGTDIHAYDYIINKLNQIFNGVNLVSTETGNPTFINFCLTNKDRNGNPYTLSTSRTTTPLAGILARTTTAMTTLASVANSNLLTPTNKNINIYIVDDIDGVAGFATLPSSHGQLFDGIFIERQFLIDNGSLNQNMEVLAHEMGHYLGLFHVFGICNPTVIDALTDATGYNPCSCDNNNCLFNGDMICDTAPSMLLQPANYTCNINTCSTDAIPYPTSGANVNPITSNVNDNKNNYMDYGFANCHSQFTVGQITRMNFMIDPIDGPRKSLVGQSACVNCADMNNCFFSINTNIPLPGTRHEITQTTSGTPAITFSPAVTTCATNTINNLIYSWELQFLNTNSVVVPTFTATNFTTALTLVPGNYQLTMTATFGSLCNETVTYNFVIYPTPLPNCNLTLPASNSAADWTADNWNRITFTNGWAIVPPIPLSPPYNYVNGSQPQIPTSSNFNSNGFDIVNLVNGALPNGYDTNFTGITLPTTANITSVIRVGEIINATNITQGNAYYAKKIITVNSQNCKFRVWYLGATNGVEANIKNPFHLASQNSDAAFGILNQYHYNSPVNTTTTFLNSDLGSDENGNLPNLRKFSNNELVSKFMNSTVGQFSTIGLPKNTQWQSYILDYSEFALLNPNTEIELTFFAHSNVVVNGLALQKAYAYFGIECLGGGIPRDFNINIPDQVLPCSSPSANQSLVLQIPSPMYTNFDNHLPIDNSTANFVNIQIFRALSPNIYSTNPEPTFSLSTGLYTLTLNATDAPFVDYRIVYKTLNKTITDDFRVFIGFNNNLQDCENGQTGGQIDVNYYTDINNDNNNSNNINIISNDILLCGTDNLPVLKLTPTCITLPHTFQWYRGNDLIPGAINEDLQLSITNPNLTMNVLNNYNTNHCHEYTRRTLYTEPYCGNPKSIQSQKFKIYNYQTINFVNISANDHDICFGENYELDVIGSSLFTYSCTIPTSFNLNNNTQNIFSFQMFDPVSLQGIGNVITQTFEGPINWSETLNNMHFVFDNVNPSNPSQPLFLPSNTGNINISLQIIGSYFGCQKNIIIPIQTFNFESSAIGGTIGFTCANNGITNVNAGITSTAGYGWQFSTDNITFNNIIGAPNTNNLPANFVTTFLGSNPTLFIRRVSFGFGTCAANAFSNVVILTNHPTSIIFNATLLPTTICNDSSAFILPTTSSNGIIGTWNVATINNTTSANYIFTPSAGYCLPPYTYNLTVTNTLVPTFNAIPPICAGQSFTLPTTSLNGVTGTWLPNINNTVTTTYTFTPTSGGCSSNLINLTVEVNPIATISFNNSNISTSFCTGSTAPILPLVDNNGITGTWNPSIVSNTSSGVYVFTPNQGQCANAFSLNISVIAIPCGFTLSWNSEVSCESAENPEIKDNNIVDGPCIRVCENSIITYNLNGSLSSIDHIDWNITGGTILTATNSSCQIQWTNAAFCAIQGTIYLTDGNTLAISKCIEKVNAPIALFGVMPNLHQTEYTVCENSSVLFENLTTNNGGNENIYYNWDFGDGTTSSAFEPIHSYHASGNYTVTLIASNGCSCSSKYTISINVEGGNVPISCPSIACENEVTTYSVPQEILGHCNINWQIIGGEIVGYDNNNTSIDVLWNHIDQDGFGYVSVLNNECFSCPTIIKVPIIKTVGTITGNASLCQKSQGTYSLPQWPSTEFNWTINNNVTGATLIQNGQRNEIIVFSQDVGVIELKCTYFNTLLGCGGTAQFTINIKPTISILGESTVCSNTNSLYTLTDANGSEISSINTVIIGPDNFEQLLTSSPFSITFPSVGIYNLSVPSSDYCSGLFNINVIQKPTSPTAI
ncbi:PKD domain-containing protein, partial [Flavobacterium sp.]|uniref:PKD domain-containing protein n=1 Tax=Flavobacterium sp. TaxID=239 RepID=UPI00375101A4